MNPDLFTNAGIVHSCYPNTILTAENKLITIRPLRKGEVVSIDFSTLTDSEVILINCQCGYNGCRKIIKGYFSLPLIIREKYDKAGSFTPINCSQLIKSK